LDIEPFDRKSGCLGIRFCFFSTLRFLAEKPCFIQPPFSEFDLPFPGNDRVYNQRQLALLKNAGID